MLGQSLEAPIDPSRRVASFLAPQIYYAILTVDVLVDHRHERRRKLTLYNSLGLTYRLVPSACKHVNIEGVTPNVGLLWYLKDIGRLWQGLVQTKNSKIYL